MNPPAAGRVTETTRGGGGRLLWPPEPLLSWPPPRPPRPPRVGDLVRFFLGKGEEEKERRVEKRRRGRRRRSERCFACRPSSSSPPRKESLRRVARDALFSSFFPARALQKPRLTRETRSRSGPSLCAGARGTRRRRRKKDHSRHVSSSSLLLSYLSSRRPRPRPPPRPPRPR